jgi:imidazolonepropionase-like amidohydrolase
VAAHALPSVAIAQAVEAGARTIEHGNFLDEPTARLMADRGAALVPTVATYVMAARHPEKYSDPPEVVAKIGHAAEGAMAAVEVAYRHGVAVGSGSDLLGDEIAWLPHEHELRAEVVGNGAAIVAATSANADILGRPDLGRLNVGCRGDVLVVRGNPLEKISRLARREAVRAVVKRGALWRCEERE